jgi:hypothetical protein
MDGGIDHSLALKSDGTVWAWGRNSFGQLGDGSTIERDKPVTVGNLSGVTAIAAGANFGLAVRTSGALLTVNAILVHPDPHYLHLFNLQIDGFTVRANANGGSTGPQIVAPGNHTVGETPGIGTHLLPRIIGGACADDGTVSLALGDNKFCTITIYDPSGGCRSQSICCEPGDDFEKCLVCSKPGQGCPGPP